MFHPISILKYTIGTIFLIFIACKQKEQQINSLQKAITDSTHYTTIAWKDSIVDFGTIKNGEKLQIKYVCKNTGKYPLIIANARPGCGCTIADFTKQPISPNNEGVVTASFDSKRFSGEVTKSIIVTTNTTNGTEHILTFKGNITGGKSNDIIMVPHPVKED